MLPATIVAHPDGRIIMWTVIGMLLGTYWFYKGFRLLQRKRLILDTPASKIRSASMGLVEVSGLAVSPYVMTSPLKRTECYYYRSVAWELRQRGKNTEWVKVAEEILHVPFYIDDNTDRVLVDPRGAEMDIHCDFQEQYHRSVLYAGPEMPGCIMEFLTRHGANPNKRIKVEEYCIKPKNFLFVLGTLSQNPGLDASVMPAWAERASRPSAVPEVLERPASAPEIVRLSSESVALPVAEMTQQQKIAAALSKAGINNPAGWTAAISQARPAAQPAKKQSQSATAVAEHEPVDPKGFDLHPPVVLMQGANQPSFFISWRSQRDVVKSLGWKSTLMIWGGPALTLACLYLLLAHFGWL